MFARLIARLSGRQVGTDRFGNMYFESRRDFMQYGRKRRWVIYAGEAETGQQPGEVGEAHRQPRRLRPGPDVERAHAERHRFGIGMAVEAALRIQEGRKVQDESRLTLRVAAPDAEGGFHLLCSSMIC